MEGRRSLPFRVICSLSQDLIRSRAPACCALTSHNEVMAVPALVASCNGADPC